MATRYTVAALAATAAELATLEADRRSNLATFLGTASRANQRSGAGISKARRVAAGLASNPPDNLTSAEAASMWRDLVNRATAITNG